MTVLIYTSKSSYTGVKVGGAETSLRLLGETLAGQGHSVIYATGAGGSVWRAVDRWINGVRVLFLPSFRNALGRRLPLWMSRRLDRLARRHAGLERAVDLRRVDIIIIYYQLDIGHYVVSRRARYGYRVVMRMAGLDWYEEARRSAARAARYSRLFAEVDAINYNSEGLRRLCAERAAELGMQLSPRREFVLDVGVAPAAGRLPWSGGSSDGRFRAVVATRFSSYQKRHDLLLGAVAILAGDEVISPADFELTLAGEGRRREEMQRLAVRLEIEALCRFVPYLPQADLWRALADSDLLCHPCEYEGLSKIIAEAMSMGVPVLASDVVPVNDQIDDRRTGFLAANSEQAWANALAELIANPELRRNVSEPARRYAAAHYDPEVNARRYIEEFERMMMDDARPRSREAAGV